jgi:RNA polymerase sigma-70 factor (ECF subfamily)
MRMQQRPGPAETAAALTETELLALARQGAAAAFCEIMRRNNRRLFRTARSVLRDDAEAEDVVQEAYLRAFQSLSGFRGEAGLSTWLTRVTFNEALGRLRRRRTAVDLEALDGAAREAGGARILIFPTVAGPDGNSDPEGSLARSQMA